MVDSKTQNWSNIFTKKADHRNQNPQVSIQEQTHFFCVSQIQFH